MSVCLSVCLSIYVYHSSRGAYGLGSDLRKRSETILVKYEVKWLCVCLSVVFLSMADLQAGDAYGLGSDHRRRSVIVLVKYEKSGITLYVCLVSSILGSL